jgi:hypothetical protein
MLDRQFKDRSPPTIESTDLLRFTPEQTALLDEINKKINAISDMDEVFLEKVKKNASKFSNNPREIKRYMNLLRFQRFLLDTLVKEEHGIRFDQPSRWILLSLKWPQVIRWLYWSSNQGDLEEKLKKLEEYASESQRNAEIWKKKTF